MLEKELKEKWLTALRSGEYAQGKGLLCKVDAEGNTRYCCLGVLLEVIHGKEVWTNDRKVSGTIWRGYTDGNDGHRTYARDIMPHPQTLIDLGVSHEEKGTPLPTMNDGGKFTFPQIADWIEDNL